MIDKKTRQRMCALGLFETVYILDEEVNKVRKFTQWLGIYTLIGDYPSVIDVRILDD